MRVLRRALVLLLLSLTATSLAAQQLELPKSARSDTAALRRVMRDMAERALPFFRSDDRDAYLNTLFRLQTVAGQYERAIESIHQLRALRFDADTVYSPVEYTQYEIFARAMALADSGLSRREAVRRAFAATYVPLNDKLAYRVSGSLDLNLQRQREALRRALDRLPPGDSISPGDAVGVLRAYHVYTVYETLLQHVPALLRAEMARRYAIDSTLSIRVRDGSTVSAIVARPRSATAPLPALLSFTIYAEQQNISLAIDDASNGYVGVVANTRGKRASRAIIEPYEHDGADAYDVISWISRQPWSDGQVGMFGGSYSGFTTWASAKHGVHPALKTIVTSAAIVPGFDSPAENGVFQSFHYAWIPYVANNRLLDDAAFNDLRRWSRMDSIWFARGVRYRALDSIDGRPSPLFQRAIAHPDYDAYWRAMTPQGAEFAKINIPVLTTTGYFDGAQIGAMRYFREHLANNPGAEHYLLIGPWEHFGAQGRPQPVVAGYEIDPAARIDISTVIHQWMDHVMKRGPMPSILADRVNYEVMGANSWRHAPGLAAMSNDTLVFHLSSTPSSAGKGYALTQSGSDADSIAQTVDFRRRRDSTGNNIHDPLADTTINLANGVMFVSDPLPDSVAMSGNLTGNLRVVINKRDMDVGVQLYELTPEGSYFQLSFYVGRASYASDPRRRLLFTPGAVRDIPFSNTRIIAKQFAKGSRLVVVVNVNQEPHSPINYGTGRDVYDETIADARVPLRITWLGSSTVRIPIDRGKRE